MTDEIGRRCRAHFLDRPWQLVQSITAYTSDGRVRNAICITRIEPDQERIKCVITSLEGIVLLNAEYDQKIEILRAIPPFDDKTFASTLFDDIRLVFLIPDGRAVETGLTASGVTACRYELNDKSFVEVYCQKDGQREIRRYSSGKKLIKTIAACYDPSCSRHISATAGEIPARITIYHHGFLEYRLELELISAETLEAD